MKKSLLVILFSALSICSTGKVMANDFGDFFSGEAPAALGGGEYGDINTINYDDPGSLFFDIEPAAGDFDLNPAIIDEPALKPKTAAKTAKPGSGKHSYRAPRITENSVYFVRKRSGE